MARDRIGGDGKCQHAGKLGVAETKSAIAFIPARRVWRGPEGDARFPHRSWTGDPPLNS